MKPASAKAFLQLMVVIAAVLGAAACGLVPMNRSKAWQLLTLAPPRPAVLVIITDPRSAQAQLATKALIMASSQARERIVVLSYQGGVVLASAVAPAPPTTWVPGPPAPIPPSATSFQKARYMQAVDHYREMVRRARKALQERQQQHLASWARSLATAANFQARSPNAGTENLDVSLGVAAAEFSSLRPMPLSLS